MSMEKNPLFPPSILNAQNTANVCRVNGTVVGMEIHEHTAISAENIAVNVISFTVNRLLFEVSDDIIIYNLSILNLHQYFIITSENCQPYFKIKVDLHLKIDKLQNIWYPYNYKF